MRFHVPKPAFEIGAHILEEGGVFHAVCRSPSFEGAEQRHICGFIQIGPGAATPTASLEMVVEVVVDLFKMRARLIGPYLVDMEFNGDGMDWIERVGSGNP